MKGHGYVPAKSVKMAVENGIPSKKTRLDDLNTVTVVIGAQFGDEGKGKIVDMLCQTADVVCRCQVGPV